MLMVISPAKTLNMDLTTSHTLSQPRFLAQSKMLMDELQQLGPVDIARLMNLSDKLAELNAQRFEQWKVENNQHTAAAILAFQGDVYQGMQAEDFTPAQMEFAQQHLRILSGLYGVLRPLDAIQAYRLEMGTALKNPRGKDLYAFWGEQLSHSLAEDFPPSEEPILVNLASQEYFKAVKTTRLPGKVITPEFKDDKNGQYKIISFFAKKARGMMAGFAIRQGITRVEDLKNFNQDGYAFNPELSSDNHWIFTRKQS